jgi:hypothetical protein
VLAGYYYVGDSTWNDWGSGGYWWSSGASYQEFYADSGSSLNGPYTGTNIVYQSVRCIQN